MCGIIGIAGSGEHGSVARQLLKGLCSLDYRGYDSSGISIASREASVQTVRTIGHPEHLKEKILQLKGTTGIAHTRWATHGAPSEENAHPLESSRITLVNNGIIENADELRSARVLSSVDTAVMVDLITECLEAGRTMLDAIREVTARMHGSWAVACMEKDDPTTIYAFRKNMPLFVATNLKSGAVTSDCIALPEDYGFIAPIPDDLVAVVSQSGIKFVAGDGSHEVPTFEKYHAERTPTDKGDFEDYFSKEIHEQPSVLEHILATHTLSNDSICDERNGASKLNLGKISNICIIGCGSSYHAGLAGKHFLESLLKIPVQVEVASEFQAGSFPLSPKSLVIAISQSGETADVLACVRKAAANKCQIVAFCNRRNTALERLATKTIFLDCGPEISVAATKSFTATLLTLHLFAAACARQQGKMSVKDIQDLLKGLRKIPEDLKAFINRDRHHTKNIAHAKHVIFTGRGLGKVIALEGALKFKELTYIPADGIAAGELKHGTLALIEEKTPVVALVIDNETSGKTAANICEARARLADVLCYGNSESLASFYPDWDHTTLKNDGPFSSMYQAAAAMQLLTWDVARMLGRNIDRPRNLAKSLTVE